MLFVGKLHSTYLFQIDSDLVLSNATPAAGHTRIKNELDKIGIKKQEVEQSMLTFSSLMLKPNRIRTFDAMT